MRAFLNALDQALEAANLAQDTLTPDLAQECGAEELNAGFLTAIQLADACERMAAALRECPGPYWRAAAATGTRKRGRSPRCGGNTPSFKRAALGPMRVDGTGGSMVCDACAQLLRKDALEQPALTDLFASNP